MDTSQLKAYAPAARKAFIAAVTAQAARLGISAQAVSDADLKGDVLLVNGEALPAAVAGPRKELLKRIEHQSFDATMEAAAYTWFNRFVALRYMELHRYLDHGYRVLSHPEAAAGEHRHPELLDHAADVDLPGLDRATVVALKLAGNKDEELYRLLLVAQCNALHAAMPFLFERIGDETELLLPAGLLNTDSLIRQLVGEIEESAWQQIEVIGWLYQFYISEKKDQVIGKVVKSEDIPAATQLFTPNWIVKYMVQNTLGAQWLATYPSSPLRAQMEYYIEPAEQTEEVQAQLAEITPSALNPEELTLLDPACGSGHILVEAYDLFKSIYLERGYRLRDVPRLILEKNLFGLDIDERAAQLTGFALMMKGRADDRQLFERGVTLNVMALQNSAGFDAVGLARDVALNDYGLKLEDLIELQRLFEHATTFGSLIQVPEGLTALLPALKELSETWNQGLFAGEALKRLGPLAKQASLLARQYDAVVANPPYMGKKSMNERLKKFAEQCFPSAKIDTFSCFIDRAFALTTGTGHSAMLTMQSWMFLSSFVKLRELILSEKTIHTMAHLGARAFDSISGEVVQTTACVFKNWAVRGFRPVFFRLLEGDESQKRNALASGKNRFDANDGDTFKKIPGAPISYWVGRSLYRCFDVFPSFGEKFDVAVGLFTCDNNRFLRSWSEISFLKIGFDCESKEQFRRSEKKFAPYNKGGGNRRWYGQLELVVNFLDNGGDIRRHRTSVGQSNALPGEGFYFKEGVTWSDVSTSAFACRFSPVGSIFDVKGTSCFPSEQESPFAMGVLNSTVAASVLNLLNPTMSYQSGDVRRVPVPPNIPVESKQLITAAASDWDAYERSWSFQLSPLLAVSRHLGTSLKMSYVSWRTQSNESIEEVKRLEEQNNRLFINAYGLQHELTADVPIEQITLTVNPAYRYGVKLSEEERETRFREDTMQELVSYAVGCMMGRYSLDAPGLIYANSGNDGFDPSRYTKFSADADGIIPLTDAEWFEDDACHRLIEFISVAWDRTHLEENLAFLAANLSPKKNESSRDTLRSYLCDKFFKDHVQTYKKRPIYWLFTSGKQKAFQCLVYLHRYNAGTVARMRSEYVIPLQGKLAARIEKLTADVQTATSNSEGKRFGKERDKLQKQQSELLAFDEKLRHYADQRISLDLDDGVKVNYSKFGDLLADVKNITGSEEDA